MLYSSIKYQDFLRAAMSRPRSRGVSPAVVVLAGAWSRAAPRLAAGATGSSDDFEELRVAAAETAARRGFRLLAGGAPSVDAVDAALAHLEDALGFTSDSHSTNASRIDAAVMEGLLCNSGAVLSMQPVRRPFRAARAVMDQTRHIMLCGERARDFGLNAAAAAAAVADDASCGTPASSVVSCVSDRPFDSVGVVAVDGHGTVVCGTLSQTGRCMLPGSVSPAATVGAGLYAANECGGAIAIGGDDAADEKGVARLCLAQEICRLMGKGCDAQQAVTLAAESLGRRLGASCAAIAIDAAGVVGVHGTVERMAWAAMLGDDAVESGSVCRIQNLPAHISVPKRTKCSKTSALSAAASSTAAPCSPVIIVHGGAGVWDVVALSASEGGMSKYYSGVKDAANVGYSLLTRDAEALKAAIAAVMCLEDNPLFNAGRGARYTMDHTVEMDAVVMNGADLSAAGTSCVKNVRNAILLVDALRTQADTALLVEEGATEYARTLGLKMEPDEYFLTDISEAFYQKERLAAAEQAQLRASASASSMLEPSPPVNLTPTVGAEQRVVTETPTVLQPKCSDTVGAVAIDVRGNVAVATSTGGRTYKMRGRVGDSPIIGCGGYADIDVGAVSTTGVGEFIARAVLAKDILDRMRDGATAQAAADAAIAHAVSRLGPTQMGAIVVGRDCDDVGVSFNSLGMAWAMIRRDHVTYGVTHEDAFPPEPVESAAAGTLVAA